MSGVELIEPTELYNLLNQINHGVPCVVNEHYLVLFEPRQLDEFHESHVLTAKHVKCDIEGEFDIPRNIDYSAVQNLVVIDNRSSSVKDFSSPAIVLAEMLWNLGSKYPVKVVKGGYEDFSALYPFLRSQKMLWTQSEIESIQTHPIEVEPGFLFIGHKSQASIPLIGKNLKVKAHVNLTTGEDTRFTLDDMVHGKNRELVHQLLNVPVEDSVSTDISQYFSSCCSFIDHHRKNDGKSVLIYSDLGISRCVTIALCYIIYHYKIPLKDAVTQLIKCHHAICPNQKFIKSLMDWEVEVLGTEISKPNNLGFLSYD